MSAARAILQELRWAQEWARPVLQIRVTEAAIEGSVVALASGLGLWGLEIFVHPTDWLEVQADTLGWAVGEWKPIVEQFMGQEVVIA